MWNLFFFLPSSEWNLLRLRCRYRIQGRELLIFIPDPNRSSKKREKKERNYHHSISLWWLLCLFFVLVKPTTRATKNLKKLSFLKTLKEAKRVRRDKREKSNIDQHRLAVGIAGNSTSLGQRSGAHLATISRLLCGLANDSRGETSAFLFGDLHCRNNKKISICGVSHAWNHHSPSFRPLVYCPSVSVALDNIRAIIQNKP